MSSIERELTPGPDDWFLFGYPLDEPRSVTETLISISGYYTTVYGYNGTSFLDTWQVYDVKADAINHDYVNDLKMMEPGKGYWIHLSEAVILRLRGNSSPEQMQTQDAASMPPMLPTTYYGPIAEDDEFQPEADMKVTAWVDDTLCGQGKTLEWGEEIVYSVKVLADGDGVAEGCGAPGKQMTFKVGSTSMATTAIWNDRQ